MTRYSAPVYNNFQLFTNTQVSYTSEGQAYTMSTGIVPLPSITETEIFLAPTSVPRCAETRAWKELIALTKFGMMRTGGLGHLMIDDEMEVWLCVQQGECLGDIYRLAINVTNPDRYKLPEWALTYKLQMTDSMCYVYHEKLRRFLPWAPNSILKLYPHPAPVSGNWTSPTTAPTTPTTLTAGFFDASVVRYPSSYSYPGAFATRSLTPVPGYAAGTSTFTAMDISNTISSCDGGVGSCDTYSGGVLGPNGLIYFVPYSANNIGVLNPSSSSFTTIDISNTISGDWKYIGGVLGPNGLIYFVPVNVDKIGVLNPSSSLFTTIDISNTISGVYTYSGGVLGPNGLIYFVPSNANNIGVLYPYSSSFITIDISNTISGGSKYAGGVLGPNGLIYFVPFNVKKIGVLNPSSSSFTTIDISNTISGDYREGNKYAGGVLGPNGLIYFVPNDADHIGVLNPYSSSFTTIDISNIISSRWKYYGGVLGPNGLIYFVPFMANNIGVLNPSSSSFTAIDISNTISMNWKYTGGVLGPNGLIYFVSNLANSIGNLHLGNKLPAYEVAGGVPEAWSSLLSPHFNKF
jgi:streptogramin lyase